MNTLSMLAAICLTTASVTAQLPFDAVWTLDAQGNPTGVTFQCTNPCVQTIYITASFIEWRINGVVDTFPINAHVEIGPQYAAATWDLPYLMLPPSANPIMVVTVEYFDICLNTWKTTEFAKRIPRLPP